LLVLCWPDRCRRSGSFGTMRTPLIFPEESLTAPPRGTSDLLLAPERRWLWYCNLSCLLLFASCDTVPDAPEASFQGLPAARARGPCCARVPSMVVEAGKRSSSGTQASVAVVQLFTSPATPLRAARLLMLFQHRSRNRLQRECVVYASFPAALVTHLRQSVRVQAAS